MDMLLTVLAEHARRRPMVWALRGAEGSLRYGELAAVLAALTDVLARRAARAVGLLLDNSPAWVAIDLAAHAAGIALVPLPGFFTAAQLMHAVRDGGVGLIVTDQPQRIRCLAAGDVEFASATPVEVAGQRLAAFQVRHARPPAVHAETAKITYTSGTTGEPKGVRLTQPAMERVAMALLDRVGGGAVQRHLSVLPLATLLENIAGAYVPLLAGGCCHLPPLAAVGVRGATEFDAARMIAALRDAAASSAILVPQMLQSLVAAGARLPDARFLAVGGAPVARTVVERARSIGLPVFEGYGLSECASVVSVNAPDADRPGSVGRPLPHVRLRFAPDGEILVAGARFQGYTGVNARPVADDYWPTGDLGHLDADGFLHLTGRKRNVFITAFGRNVAPEWVERELTAQPGIAQAAVFGEARPWNLAVVVPRDGAPPGAIAAAVRAANRGLPDYAQVRGWIVAAAPFGTANGQLTATGRVRREAVFNAHRAELDERYLSFEQEVPA